MKKLQKFVVLTLAFQLSFAGFVAQVQSAMISAGDVMQAQRGDTSLDKIENWLARSEVHRQLTEMGVAPEHARERIRSLTDSELNEMATRLEQLPAGAGGVIEVLGIVFIVLLILEFVGVIDIFKRR